MDGDTLAPGTRFGVYEIVRLLGRGGMGAVYEARHTALEKAVALKVLARQYASNAESCERFVREGRAASKIRHPHIVDVSDLGVSGDQPFLVMEYLAGEDLSHLLERDGAMTPTHVAEVMLPVISAVQAAHDNDIVHRDLKPENIFLARTVLDAIEPKVLDFGIAKLGGSAKAITGTAAMMGTAYYMSPEQVRGAGAVGPASDQFTLGVILYQCVTGVRPFDGDNVIAIIHAISLVHFRPPSAVWPGIPPGFEQLILRAMAPHPEQRFASVRDLGRALFAFADDTTRARWARTFGDVSGRHSSEVVRGSQPKVVNTFVGAMTAPGPLSGERPIPMTLDPTPAPVSRVSSPLPSAVPSSSVPSQPLPSQPAYVASPPPGAASTGPVTVPPPAVSTFAPISQTLGPKTAEPAPNRGTALVGGLAVILTIVVIAVIVTRTTRHAPRPSSVVVAAAGTGAAPELMHLDAVPATASFVLDGRALGQGAIDLVLPTDGATHALTVSADGYEPRTLDVGHGRPPPRIDLVPLPPPPTGAPILPAGIHPGAHPHAELPTTVVAPEHRTPHHDDPDRGANGALIVE